MFLCGKITLMKGFTGNIEYLTKSNKHFRKVLFTGPRSQLVVMNLKPGEEIGEEVHSGNDQFIRIEEGAGEAILDGKKAKIEDNWAIVIPSGMKHNIINTSKKPLKLYTIYSPPEHKDGTIHKTKSEADEHHH